MAEELSAAGGAAETAQVDALDEEAVEQHADAVAEKAGGIDVVSFNAIFNGDVQGTPLAELGNVAAFTASDRASATTATPSLIRNMFLDLDQRTFVSITLGPLQQSPSSSPRDGWSRSSKGRV